MSINIKLLGCADDTFIKEFESRKILKCDFKDLLSVKLYLDALSLLNNTLRWSGMKMLWPISAGSQFWHS